MAKRRSTRRSSGTRTVYRSIPRKGKKRRSSTLNRSVKKPMQATGVAIGLLSVYGPAAWQSITTMNANPILGTVMNKNAAVEAAKRVAVGYIGGTAAGIVADKSGLKRPVNKVLRTFRGLI
jgi:hypothetical protein